MDTEVLKMLVTDFSNAVIFYYTRGVKIIDTEVRGVIQERNKWNKKEAEVVKMNLTKSMRQRLTEKLEDTRVFADLYTREVS